MLRFSTFSTLKRIRRYDPSKTTQKERNRIYISTAALPNAFEDDTPRSYRQRNKKGFSEKPEKDDIDYVPTLQESIDPGLANKLAKPPREHPFTQAFIKEQNHRQEAFKKNPSSVHDSEEVECESGSAASCLPREPSASGLTAEETKKKRIPIKPRPYMPVKKGLMSAFPSYSLDIKEEKLVTEEFFAELKEKRAKKWYLRKVKNQNARDIEGAFVATCKMVEDYAFLRDELIKLVSQKHVKDITTFNYCLKTASTKEQVEDIFRLATKAHFTPSKQMYTTMVVKYGESGGIELALQLIKDLEKKGHILEFNTYQRVLTLALKHDDITSSLEILEEIRSRFLKTERVSVLNTYRQLIEYFGKAWNMLMVETLFNELKKRGPRPDTLIYASVIDAYATWNFEMAERHFKSFKKSPVTINTHLFNAILKACVTHSKANEAVTLYAVAMNKIRPDRFTYFWLIKSMLDQDNTNGAFQFYQEMKRSRKTLPNDKIYAIFIKYYGDRGMINEMIAFFNASKSEQSYPAEAAHVALLRGYAKNGKWLNAYKCYDSMLLKFPLSLCNSNLVTILAQYGDFSMAVVTYKTLKNVHLYAEAHGAMAGAYTDKGKKPKALEAFKACQDDKTTIPCVHATNNFIKMYCSFSMLDKGFKVFQKIRKSGRCPANSLSYRTILQFITGKKGYEKHSKEIFEELVQRFGHSDCVTEPKDLQDYERQVLAKSCARKKQHIGENTEKLKLVNKQS